MTALLRFSLFASLAVSMLVGGRWVLNRLGVGVGQLAEWARRVESQQVKSLELDRRAVAGYRRIVAKAEVVEDLAAGRLTFREAASRFGAICRTMTPEQLVRLRANHTAGSDDEMFARELLGYLRARESKFPERGRLARRLEAELADHVRRGTL